jgi:hypothetical protein
MTRFSILLACAIGVFGVAGASRAEIQSGPEDKAAIEAILAENVAALNKHDPIGASRQYMPDAELPMLPESTWSALPRSRNSSLRASRPD